MNKYNMHETQVVGYLMLIIHFYNKKNPINEDFTLSFSVSNVKNTYATCWCKVVT